MRELQRRRCRSRKAAAASAAASADPVVDAYPSRLEDLVVDAPQADRVRRRAQRHLGERRRRRVGPA